MSSPAPKSNQLIKYTGNETEYSAQIVGQNVTVICKPGVHTLGSSKVKLINKIDYNWEFRYYHGHLIAAHINGKVFAYAMKGKDGGMIRVCNLETDVRALIKNLKDDVRDISFAVSKQEIILGCVDSEGNVLIYQIHDQPSEIKYELLLHIYLGNINVTRSHINYRIIWCPYVSNFDEEDTGEDPERMFVVLNGPKAEVYNVDIMNSKHGVGPFQTDDSYEGYIGIDHNDDLVDASFSTDGTAIAIASVDGFVKFFQLYMGDEEKEKCLHQWKPHEGRPLSSIIFIDNVLEYSSECWKFMITGAHNNSEIKIWSCETWSCLQMITFKSDPTSPIPTLYFNMSIDYTSRYLVVSDINNRVLYIIQLERIDNEQTVRVSTLSQFQLPAAFLSFHILDACSKKLPYSFEDSAEDIYSVGGGDDDDDVETLIEANYLQMLVVQPKKFQECKVIYSPELLIYKTKCDIIGQDEAGDQNVPKLDDLQNSVSLLIQQQSGKNGQMNLMTPEDFRDPNELRPSSVRNSLTGDGQNSNEGTVDNLIDFKLLQKDNFASGGSSPSREVQEILSLNNSTYSTQEFFDNLSKLSVSAQDAAEEDDDTITAPQKPQEYNGVASTVSTNEVNDRAANEDLDVASLLTNNTSSSSTDMVWPKLPIVDNSEMVKEGEIVIGERAEEAAAQPTTDDVNNSNLQSINFRISSLENTIREQSIQLQKLSSEMREREKESREWHLKELELLVSKQNLQLAKVAENVASVAASRKSDAGAQQEHRLALAVSEVVERRVGDRMRETVAAEVTTRIAPQLLQMMDQYRKQIDVLFAQRMASADVALKDSISKAINNTTLAESLSLSVAKIVAPSLEKCYRDIVYSSLVPSWEKVCSQMFQQINETFSQGTKEYTACVENYMDRQRRVQEKGKDMMAQMHNVSENMKSNADRLAATITAEFQKQFNSSFKNMQDRLTSNLRETVSAEVKQAFKNHASVLEDSVINAVRSRAVTPSPHFDTQATLQQIQQYLTRGNYDEAFQLALGAENLSFVIYACEKTDINTLFGDECLLKPSCLLALIQQLSMDLIHYTELKFSYIQAALLALSTENSSTKQFIPKVIKDLLKQLHIFLNTSTSAKHIKEAKLLKMVAESFLK